MSECIKISDNVLTTFRARLDWTDESIGKVESLGLVYFDDFFDLPLSHPDWLKFSADYADIRTD